MKLLESAKFVEKLSNFKKLFFFLDFCQLFLMINVQEHLRNKTSTESGLKTGDYCGEVASCNCIAITIVNLLILFLFMFFLYILLHDYNPCLNGFPITLLVTTITTGYGLVVISHQSRWRTLIPLCTSLYSGYLPYTALSLTNIALTALTSHGYMILTRIKYSKAQHEPQQSCGVILMLIVNTSIAHSLWKKRTLFI